MVNLADNSMATLALPIEGDIKHVMVASPSELILHTEGTSPRRQLHMLSANQAGGFTASCCSSFNM